MICGKCGADNAANLREKRDSLPKGGGRITGIPCVGGCGNVFSVEVKPDEVNLYEKACKTWLTGCSDTENGAPEDCKECTTVFREHIQSIAHLRTAHPEIFKEACEIAGRVVDDAINNVNRASRWTSTPPTEPGWYWYKSTHSGERGFGWLHVGEIIMACVFRKENGVLRAQFPLNGLTGNIDTLHGQWYGPLTPPE